MTRTAKDDLQHYLTSGREALLWKLEGVSEYDVRRPLVPTGTNLLGLVKHVASVEAGYLGAVFGRPFPDPMPWIEDSAEDNADMWATAEQSREWVVDLSAGWARTPRPHSPPSSWTRAARCRGGRPSAAASPCTRSWCR